MNDQTFHIHTKKNLIIHSLNGGVTEYIYYLEEKEAYLNLQILLNLEGESPQELTIKVVHQAPNTKADITLRTILNASNQLKFAGYIQVEPTAFNSQSSLSHHTLLTSGQVHLSTLPALRINNSRVQCAHQVTVHTLNEKDIFYLTNRGLNPDLAKQLILNNFLNPENV
jgi:Fe-S cluster assembly scaffold protein SufB